MVTPQQVMIADQIVEPTRQRCRGDAHRPGCAHLGNDPTRKLCRGDAHKPNCRHLHPVASRPVGRPKKARKARSDNGVSRSIARKVGGSATTTHPAAGRADTERETTTEIGPYMGTAGPSGNDRGSVPPDYPAPTIRGSSQSCSNCGTVEAAGSYCTKCLAGWARGQVSKIGQVKAIEVLAAA